MKRVCVGIVSSIGRAGVGKPRGLRGPLVDKFFVIGLSAGLIGAVVLGIPLWLMREGSIAVGSNYAMLRELHALMQIHLFVGACIVGFLIQATPRLLGSPSAPPRQVLLLFPAYITAAVCIFIPALFIVARALFAGIYIGAALNAIRLSLGVPPEVKFRVTTPIVFGLLALACAVCIDVTIPAFALLILWCGLFPIIGTAARHFLRNLTAGPKSPLGPMIVMTFVYILSVVTGLVVVFSSDIAREVWTIFAGLVSITIVLYLSTSGIHRVSGKARMDVLFLSFSSGAFWLVAGALSLFSGISGSDVAVHLWATGVVVPLLLAVSCRILSALANYEVLSQSVITALLLAWQTVPFGRGFVPLLGLSRDIVPLGAFFAATVFVVWYIAAIMGIWSILSNQWRIQRNGVTAHG